MTKGYKPSLHMLSSMETYMYIQVHVQFGTFFFQPEYVYMGSMYTEWRGVRERGRGRGRGDGEEGEGWSSVHEGRGSFGMGDVMDENGEREEGGKRERDSPVGYLDCTMSSVL